MPLEQAKGIIGKAPVSSSQKANFTVTDVGDDLYQIVHSKYSCVANMCKNQCSCPDFFCAGKCNHLQYIDDLKKQIDAQNINCGRNCASNSKRTPTETTYSKCVTQTDNC